MAKQKEHRKIYYQVLQGSECMLADERNKRKLLDLLLGFRQDLGWRTFAFCVTDDNAYFISEAADRSLLKRRTEAAAGRFLRESAGLPAYRGVAPSWTAFYMERISSLPELPERCREIHMIPLERGYVSKLANYWWSSYITYLGGYVWETLDCNVVYQQFDPDQNTARHRFIQYHKYKRSRLENVTQEEPVFDEKLDF